MPYAVHPSFIDSQNDGARVWRYMDLAKLLATIDKQALFFPAAATLAKDDQFEGQPPFPEIQDLIDDLPNTSDAQIQAARNRHYHQLPLFHHLNFFSCWHMNDGESDAMWKLYVKDGMRRATQSSVHRLKCCFAKTERFVHIGLIQYIDYNQTPPPVSRLGTSWFLCKRRAFAHEQELRVGVWSEEVEVRYMKEDGSLGSPENHDWQDIVLKHPDRAGVKAPPVGSGAPVVVAGPAGSG